MDILILTPDTDIDRRIILQANELINQGHHITIVGAPYNDKNYLSGKIDEQIDVVRINAADITYDDAVVKWYYNSHKKIDNKAIKRNNFLNKIGNKGYTCKEGALPKFRNKFIKLLINTINVMTTKYYGLSHRVVNRIYTMILFWVRIFKINFFPNFDDGFYNVGSKIDADCIVANDLPALKAGYKLASEKGIPLVYDAHENYTEQCTLPKKLVRKFEEIENEILPLVKFWIVPNEFLGNAVIEKYRRVYNTEIQEPIVIQNAVSYIEKLDRQDIIREKLNLGLDKKIILFQGGFLPKRNLENMVKAMKYVTNPNAVMVLLGFGGYVETLKQIVTKNKIQDKVYFLDAVPQSELIKYTCSADIGLIPYGAVDKNTYFCSPNKLYEYIQGRLPILANDLPFLRKVVMNNNFGQVADFSKPISIAQAIESMLKNENNLEGYRDNLENRAFEYSWQVEAKKLVNKYNEEVCDINKKEVAR